MHVRLTLPCCSAQATALIVLASPTVALTFGSGQSIGTFGPSCKNPVAATASVTGVTGFATPTGNVTLSLRAMHPGLHPAYTITVQTVRSPFASQLSIAPVALSDAQLIG